MVLDDFIKAVSTKAGVYQFYVYPLGKYYIGESVNIRRRVKEHLTKGKDTGEEYFFNSASQASKVLKLNPGNITSCCRNKQKTSGKIYWSYEND